MPYELKGQTKEATKAELKRYRTQCSYYPKCKTRAWLRDWSGWKWCFKHWYWKNRWGGGNRWFDFKTVKVFFK